MKTCMILPDSKWHYEIYQDIPIFQVVCLTLYVISMILAVIWYIDPDIYQATVPNHSFWYGIFDIMVCYTSPVPIKSIPYVGITILIWVVNKSLKSKPASGTGRPWPTLVVVPKKKTNIFSVIQVCLHFLHQNKTKFYCTACDGTRVYQSDGKPKLIVFNYLSYSST